MRVQERRKQLEAERQARLEEMKQKRQDQVGICYKIAFSECVFRSEM